MHRVEPIRDINKIHDIEDYLKSKNERDYIMFLFGIYSGLRISDILPLRVRDVRGKDSLVVTERKTGKERRFRFNPKLKAALKHYIKNKRDYECLFASQKGYNQPLGRHQAWAILNEAGRRFGLESIGTHTMRKTFGYHMYQQTHDIATIQKILNHSSQLTTMMYIGVTQDRMDDYIHDLRY